MKNNIFKSLLSASLIVGGVGGGLTSCSDEFLSDKKNFDNVSVDIYNYYEGANARINDIYAWCLPDVNAEANWKYNCTGMNDTQAKCTEEYSGFGAFVDPDNILTTNGGAKVPDYFHNQSNNIQASVWGRIRNINDVIQGINDGSLSEAEKNELAGQAYFLRAWCYYQLVKWYGGVPIVTEVQTPTEDAVTPRSSAKACFEFIVSDLNKSADMLKAATAQGGWNADKYGHVTAGTALALKGRVLNLWASPMFNRANDKSRWETAYNEQKKDLETIRACGHDLYTVTGDMNASAFAGMFSQTQCSEAVFVTLYNTVQSGNGQKNNGWERSIRPTNIGGGGGKEASAMLVDMFPMSDGKRPTATTTYTTLQKSDIAYDREHPFMNRDPRFYRTFAFPGVRWASAGTTSDVGNAGGALPKYDKGYELWNYVWYVDKNDAGNVESGNSYAADSLLDSKRGIYVRKRSMDSDVASPLYAWSAVDAPAGKGYQYSAAPYMEIRFAEVLLNLAEAAAGAGKCGDAVEQLQLIRARVGYTAENNYGLQDNLSTDEAACMAAVLYERQIELAYEGKRFDDLRRWMLYDGGTGSVAGAPASWKLTGWGGNTCAYLGFTPLNGQRRENMQFRVADKWGVGGTTASSDPLLQNGVARPAAVDYRKELSSQLETLKEWYVENLTRKDNKGDARDQNKNDEYMAYQPHYYFLGLSTGAQSSNKALPQTIGWDDYNNGGAAGTFDPLAE